MKGIYILILAIMLISCNNMLQDDSKDQKQAPQATSLLGEPLYPSEPAERVLAEYQKYSDTWEMDQSDPDKLIWFGRFTAYKGDYKEAIELYSKGIELFPEDARFYRHRGHRYISIREFEKAIDDFQEAVKLIENTENETEPDGMPNARNIPVSTLHGNIWYHLGLAYYLIDDMENAYNAYLNCLNTGSNNDNIVSSTHWLYMISRRMGLEDQAYRHLDVICDTMDVIENMDYHRACLFYKGEISMNELLSTGDGSGSDAVKYALGNWHYYNGNHDKALYIWNNILSGKSWASFGYIAAEADIARLE